MSIVLDLTDNEAKCLIKALVLNYADTHDDFSPTDIGECNQIKENLLGELISKSSNYDFYRDTKDNRFSRKDPIRKKLFMGAGHHSIVQKNGLHQRLEFACYELSGLEQNGGQGTEFDQQMNDECILNIKDVIKDIAYALNMSVGDIKCFQ
jgi:hypothetical protein